MPLLNGHFHRSERLYSNLACYDNRTLEWFITARQITGQSSYYLSTIMVSFMEHFTQLESPKHRLWSFLSAWPSLSGRLETPIEISLLSYISKEKKLRR